MLIKANIAETSLVLDNDVLTHLRNGQPYAKQAIRECFRHLRPPALTSITVFEAFFGIENQAALGKLPEEKYRNSVEELTKSYAILNFDRNSAVIAAYIYPRVFAHIEKLPNLSKKDRKEKLRDIWKDTLVASTALAYGYGVATGNQKDFELIARHLPLEYPVLRLATWKP